MGVRFTLSPHLFALMSAEDQPRYAQTITQTTDPAVAKLDRQPLRKSSVAEKNEQGTFASWLLLQNSKGRKIPFCWHSTCARSKATPGTPDFWVGINGRSLWIEFKRDSSCKLTPEQDEFRLGCEAQRIEHHVVYSAEQAIGIVQQAEIRVAR
jgi:hypothetical protein